MSRRLIGPLIVIVIAVAVVALLTLHRPASVPISTAVTTSTSPTDFVLPSLTGHGLVRLESYRGHPVVVDLFASWCSACQAELPDLAAASVTLRGRVTFIGVNSEETGNGLAMAQQYHITSWPLASDINGANDSGLHDALGALGMPATAFYSASGRLLKVVQGRLTTAELSGYLARLDGITLAA